MNDILPESGAILSPNVRSGRRLTALELLCQGCASAEVVAAREATRASTQSSHHASGAEIHCDDSTGKKAILYEADAEEQSSGVSQGAPGASHSTTSTRSRHSNDDRQIKAEEQSTDVSQGEEGATSAPASHPTCSSTSHRTADACREKRESSAEDERKNALTELDESESVQGLISSEDDSKVMFPALDLWQALMTFIREARCSHSRHCKQLRPCFTGRRAVAMVLLFFRQRPEERFQNVSFASALSVAEKLHQQGLFVLVKSPHKGKPTLMDHLESRFRIAPPENVKTLPRL